MDLNCDLLKSWENEWKTLGDKDKLIQLGKLKMLEELKIMFDMYQESLVRELKINNCESEEDCLNPKEIEKNRPYKDPELIEVKTIEEKPLKV